MHAWLEIVGKSVWTHATFTMKKDYGPHVTLNNHKLEGMHVDRGLIWSSLVCFLVTLCEFLKCRKTPNSIIRNKIR